MILKEGQLIRIKVPDYVDLIMTMFSSDYLSTNRVYRDGEIVTIKYISEYSDSLKIISKDGYCSYIGSRLYSWILPVSNIEQLAMVE